MMVAVLKAALPSAAGVNSHLRAACIAGGYKRLGPERGCALVTFPLLSIDTSTATVPSARNRSAAGEYSGVTRFITLKFDGGSGVRSEATAAAGKLDVKYKAKRRLLHSPSVDFRSDLLLASIL